MVTGIVKWFDAAKGFGFIEQTDGGADVFAHFSYIADRSLLGLLEGQEVAFEIRQGPKAPHAVNIVLA
ncbi:cold-shock protein [Streptomyces sp. Wb2n-11]|uniref:cold-shock protein n=1 Tax=Streptomyces sp. Wb2n-11 TaxID=1030533 RepID=UPI000A4471B6|nr:cold-shock protein [Streptomyces sp. Wb2n-11]